MTISSYGVGKRESSGRVRVDYDLKTDVRGKDVLIVEDIIDSGNTLHEALPLIEAKGPNSVEICTLLNKSSRREVEVPLRLPPHRQTWQTSLSVQSTTRRSLDVSI
jgi:hypoxanthine phosphoribosyltransferase